MNEQAIFEEIGMQILEKLGAVLFEAWQEAARGARPDLLIKPPAESQETTIIDISDTMIRAKFGSEK